MSGISAHMIVKNEDQWLYFSLNSILPYVDQVLVTDTGSSDHTRDILRSFASPKIHLTFRPAHTAQDLTQARTNQLHATKTPWLWIIDGDEVYPPDTAAECVRATQDPRYEGVVVRRYDLLGDIYHRQVETVGSYELFGHKGHLLVRLLNRDKIAELNYLGDYPREGFFDGVGNSILDHDPKHWYITHNYLYHAMYLKRSSLGSNLPMFNRSKYKIETGLPIASAVAIPSVFSLPHPSFIADPLARRGLGYELAARIITPIKTIKRQICA